MNNICRNYLQTIKHYTNTDIIVNLLEALMVEFLELKSVLL